MNKPDLMTIEQIAQLFHVSKKTVYRRIRRKLLPAPIKGTIKPMLFIRKKIYALAADSQKRKTKSRNGA